MPVCWLLTTLTSNPPLYAAPFWTFSCLLAASTSNPPLSRSPFGLHPAYLLAPHCFNVQSVPPAAPFWTSSCLFTASPPLQHPILHTIALPFGLPPAYLLPSHHFSVQSAILSLSFWTSSCLLTTLTSNLPPSTLELEHPLKKHLIFRHKYIHN